MVSVLEKKFFVENFYVDDLFFGDRLNVIKARNNERKWFVQRTWAGRQLAVPNRRSSLRVLRDVKWNSFFFVTSVHVFTNLLREERVFTVFVWQTPKNREQVTYVLVAEPESRKRMIRPVGPNDTRGCFGKIEAGIL